MNTLDPDAPSVWGEVRAALPDLAWESAAFAHGAFHRVAVLGTSSVVRVSAGADHAARAETEHRNLTVFADLGLPFRVPSSMSPPVTTPEWSAQVTTFVPGEHRPGLSWPEARRALESILDALLVVDPLPSGLRPVRHWCGGDRWPGIVERIVHPLDEAVRTAACQAVSALLDAEAGVEPTLLHGDMGLHNVLWEGDEATGVIDLDNACIGDPALDLAPLIGAFGSARVADIADPHTIDRARRHRATLPLQVAAAAESVDDHPLRDFALANFQKRLAAGTLEDPSPA